MKRLGPCAAATLLAASVATAAAAETTVFRCGPEGREFSATPCAEGRALQVDDSRTPAQQREARLAAQREARLADQLVQERRAREAAPVKGAARIGPAARAPAPAASQPKKKRKKHRTGPDADDGFSPAYRAPAK